MKRDLARKHANFYIIDAAKLAQEIGLALVPPLFPPAMAS